ncbi:MAG: hypothetical protein FWE07_02750 [Turicibacter sp.]|nr:hypothetical protein [Turicibacter sp.]
MEAKSIIKLYLKTKKKIQANEDEVKRLENQIDIYSSEYAQRELHEKKEKDCHRSILEIKKENDHYRKLLEIVDKGLKLVKEQGTDYVCKLFYQNNFDGRTQENIAMREHLSKSTTQRMIGSLNHLLIEHIKLELEAYLEENAEFQKLLKKKKQKLKNK